MKRTNNFNKILLVFVLIYLLIAQSCSSRLDKIVTPAEMRIKSNWVKEHLLDANPVLPFSFIYDGKASSELLKTWHKKTQTTKLDDNRTQYTHYWTDIKTGLEVRCVAVEYSDFPSVEWTVYFKNTGTNNSPILKDIQGLDARFEKNAGGEFGIIAYGDTLHQAEELILDAKFYYFYSV